MDRFARFERTGRYNINAQGGKIMYDISYDKFDDFIKSANTTYSNGKNFVINDGTIPKTMDEKLKRLYVLEKINSSQNVERITLILSDDSLRLYNELMKRMKWRHKDVTYIQLSINRDLSKLATLRLDELQGQITDLGQDDLVWLPDNVIRSLKGKTSFTFRKATDNDLEDAIKLKRFIESYANGLEDKYYFQRLTDFDKMFIVYNDIKDSIKFANDRTKYSKQLGCVVLNASESHYESYPYGTLVHRSGVCEGQSRLYKSMLSNPYLDVNCQLISGRTRTGESHMWTGVIVDDKLYQVCLTMQGMFGNVDRAGYKPFLGEIYSEVYPHAFLTLEDKSRIERHVRSLRKK